MAELGRWKLRRITRRGRLAMSLGLVVALAVTFVPLSTNGQTSGGRVQPRSVKTTSDAARRKLDRGLLQAFDRHTKGDVAVFASVVGNPKGALRQLRNGRATRTPRATLVVGSIPAQRLLKLASDPAVVAVRPISFRRDGTPHDIKEGRGPAKLTGAAKAAAIAKAQNEDVPYPQAPPPRGSTFQQYRKLNVLDARTHNFTEAWNKGFTGKGSTAAVLDSGTDWGHPDLIGADVAEDDSGWPAAFDPFGTLEWLVAELQPARGHGRPRLHLPVRLDQVGHRPARQPPRRLRPRAVRRAAGVPGGRPKRGWRLRHRLRGPERRPQLHRREAGHQAVAAFLARPQRRRLRRPVRRDALPHLRRHRPVWAAGARRPRSVRRGRQGRAGRDPRLDRRLRPADRGAWHPLRQQHRRAGRLQREAADLRRPPRQRQVSRRGRRRSAPHHHGPVRRHLLQLQFLNAIRLPADQRARRGRHLQFLRRVGARQRSARREQPGGGHLGDRVRQPHHRGPLERQRRPGFGTTTPASPVTGIGVGASTQFGGTGWDSIKSYRQVTDNDVANWSNRGPGANGAGGIDLVADGAYSPGDVPVNAVVDGTVAWETWGGTSRSTPVAAGAAALVYQAWRSTHPGAAIPIDFGDRVREYLKSGAKDLGYESYIQGSGSLDAGRSVRLARGKSATVTPDEWRPGDFHGEEFRAFPHLIAPGETDTQRFTLDGPGTYTISDRVLRRTDTTSFNFTTSDVGKETPSLFNAPNYLIDLTKLVKSHPKADLMVIRSNYPYNQFDPDGDYSADQQWRMVTYNWTDRNHDRRLYTDRDRDGTLDEFPSAQTNIDGNPIPDFTRSEIQEGEYERFTYINQETNAYTNMVRSPRKRMADGVFLGFYHNLANANIRKTSFHIQVDFFSNTDWSWVSTPRKASGAFTARIKVPSRTPYGLYDDALVVSRNDQKSIVPVAVTVAAVAPQDADGNLTSSLRFGGTSVARAQRNQLYNNGSVFDAKDWGWRAESGDWRFYYFDVPKQPPAGTRLLADTTWAGPSRHNDIDTLVFGKVTNTYQVADGSDPIFAPYALGTVGGSENTNVGAGVWLFDTATGGPEELVTAPVQHSLHAVVQHEVNMQHDRGEVDLPFATTVAGMQLTPDHVEVQAAGDSGSFDVTFKAGLDLPGLSADGFGLSQPSVTTETARQDDPNDPATASVKRPFTIAHAGHATISATLPGEDIDLFVVRDANGDGEFTNDEIVAASATASGSESVTMTRPPDGSYQVWVHGFAVSSPQQFPLTIDAVQGSDLTVSGVPSGPLPANTPVTLHVTFAKAMTSGQDYKGELLLGPTPAPTAVTVPITVHRQ